MVLYQLSYNRIFPLSRVLRGRYWDRTSDLFRVREARYRCANRPSCGWESKLPEPKEESGSFDHFRAVDEIRTRDIHLGKVVLYQLSYNRITAVPTFIDEMDKSISGRYWDRTSDLFRVREARYRCANRPNAFC